MPAITNWGTLKTAVQVYTRRDDLTAELPTYLQFASQRLLQDLRCQWLETSTPQLTMIAGAAGYPLPADFAEIKSVYIDRGQASYYLEYVEDNLLSPALGIPKAYTLTANSYQFGPTPYSDYKYFLTYKAAPSELIGDADTNAFIKNAPEALLKAICAEMMRAVVDDARFQAFNAEYMNAVAHQNMQEWNMPTSIVAKPSTRVR